MPKIILDDPDSTLEMLRDSVATVAARLDGATLLRRRRAANADLNTDVWAEMAEAGWLGVMLPEDMGGAGLGAGELAVLAEALGRALFTEPFAALAVFPGVLLATLGGDLASEIATGIADGSRIVPVLHQDLRGATRPFAATPSESGKASGTASGTAETLTISGQADYVMGAASATEFLLLCTLQGNAGGELCLVHLSAGSEGISLSSRPGVDGIAIGRVDVQNATGGRVVARGNAVAAAMATATETTRLALAAEAAGVASKALEDTVDYTRGRVQFGQPIASFQVIQHRLVDMWGDAEFACSAVTNAVEMIAEDTPEAAAMAVLAAKARAGDAAVTITRRAIHLHGAMGFTDECNIGLYNKRAIHLNAMLGQSEELRLEFLDRDTAA